jgi:outer membrane protein
MKKVFIVLVASLFLAASGYFSLVFSADKIAVVDLYKLLNESEAGKKAKTDLESLIKTKQSLLDEKGKNIEKLKTDLEKQTPVISPEAKKTKEEELERLARDYQRLVSDSQGEVKKKEAELTSVILKDARELINKIAQEKGYSLVIEKADGLVLYYSSNLDITDTIIKKMNELKADGKKTETKAKPTKK